MAEKLLEGTPGTPTGTVFKLKHLRGTPTFQTPHRPRKRAPLREVVAGEGEEAPVRRLSFDAGGGGRGGVV